MTRDNVFREVPVPFKGQSDFECVLCSDLGRLSTDRAGEFSSSIVTASLAVNSEPRSFPRSSTTTWGRVASFCLVAQSTSPSVFFRQTQTSCDLDRAAQNVAIPQWLGISDQLRRVGRLLSQLGMPSTVGWARLRRQIEISYSSECRRWKRFQQPLVKPQLLNFLLRSRSNLKAPP